MLDLKKYTSLQRIRHHRDFNLILKNGSHSFDDHWLFYYHNNNFRYARLGMIINKKKCHLAVWRNQLKRHIREQFRLQQHNLVGIDLVIMLKSPTNKSQISGRVACVKTLLVKLGQKKSASL